MITVNPPEAPKIGTIGPPVVDVDVAIDETAADQSAFEDDPGEVGELLVKGPNVTRGYWNKPGATERAFTDEVPGGGSDAAADSDADEPTEPMGADGALPASGSEPVTSSTNVPTATSSSVIGRNRSSCSRRVRTSRPR